MDRLIDAARGGFDAEADPQAQAAPTTRAPFSRLRDAFQHILRPAVGFTSPDDVVKDPDLTNDEKRAILASWASDASAVEGRPDWRWLIGTPEPVRRADVLEGLKRLDRAVFAEAPSAGFAASERAPWRRPHTPL